MFIGSDALGLAHLTQRICYLEEGDWAVLNGTGGGVSTMRTARTSNAPSSRWRYRAR